MRLGIDDLRYLATGSAFLGAGGGGDPYIGRLLAASAIEEFGSPELVPAEEVHDDARVLTIAMLGAPTVMLEKAVSGDDIEQVIKSLEARLGEKADYLMSIEIGGINSMVPVMAAARLGVPVIDADGMGRAFPELQMVTFNAFGVSATPLVMSDDHGSSMLVEAPNAKAAEDLVRAASVPLGCSAVISCYPMRGRQVKDCAVLGTISLARSIGETIAESRQAGDPVKALAAHLRTTPYYSNCLELFDGKVVDVRRELKGGFSIGFVKMIGLEGGSHEMEVVFQNEFLVARLDGATRAIVPDLVCLVDRETAEPVPADAVRYGQRIKVLGVSAPPVMCSPESLSIFGPQAFGMDEPFVPLEELCEEQD